MNANTSLIMKRAICSLIFGMHACYLASAAGCIGTQYRIPAVHRA